MTRVVRVWYFWARIAINKPPPSLLVDANVPSEDKPPFDLDELARRLAEAVPAGMRSVGEDLEKNFKTLLASGLGRLDLVTREEFDVQVAVLERTREKLEQLEARLAAHEDKSKT